MPGCMPPARSRRSATREQPRGGGGLPELRRRLNAALPPDLTVRSLRAATAGLRPEARGALARLPLPDPDERGQAIRSNDIGRSRSTNPSTRPPCGRRRRGCSASATSRRWAPMRADGRSGTSPSCGSSSRGDLARDPRDGERLPAAHGAQHRGRPDGGRSRTARAGGGRSGARRRVRVRSTGAPHRLEG